MIKNILFLIAFMLFYRGISQNVGINTDLPQSSLDINGDLTLRIGELTLADGVNASVDVNTLPFANYRINGPTAPFTVAGITASVDGRLMSLINSSGFIMTISHEDVTAAPMDRIVLENGTFLQIPPNAIANFQYNTNSQRWMLKSHSVISGNSTSSNAWSLDGNNGVTASNFIGSINNEPVTIKSFNNTVAYFQHGYPSNNYIGTNYQRTGIGILGQGAPTHTLEIGLADLAGGSNGVLGIRGSQYMSHFNFGNAENTYIRAGKTGGKILLNDLNGLGNVGIGLEFPAFKFHVNGNGGFNSNSAFTFSEVLPMIYKFGDGALQWTSPNLENYPLGIEENNIIVDGNKIQSFVRNIDDPSISDYSRSIIINPFGGNIGIGISNPTATLSVSRNDGVNGTAAFHGTTHVSHFNYSTSENTYIRGGKEGSVVFINDHSGPVVIGSTLNYGYKLSVNGSIRSKEVVVENINWPDYVFQKDYKLKSLTEIEKYINENHHLPNIPSAKEIESKGQALGEIQKKMMEKIEELTLYIIDQNKKLELLEMKVIELQKELNK